MKRLTLELGEDDYRYLKDRATREGRTVVSLLRDAVSRLRSEAFDPRKDPMYKVGSFEGGPADLAENHDDYLYE